MNWLYSPKVRLALIVNGLYFVSLFTAPAPRHARPHLFPHPGGVRSASRATMPQPDPRLPPPPLAPTRATVFESGGMLQISLNKDLTLVQRPGRTLLLAPSLSANKYPSRPPAAPSFVSLNFIVFAEKETCPGDCPLLITADGKTVWPEYTGDGTTAETPNWKREHVPRSTEKLADGQVVERRAVETLSMNISYKQFTEMIGAKRVVIRLGTERVELTADQVEALRDMNRLLPQPPPASDDAY